MSNYIKTYVIEGVAYEVHGAYDMYPELDESGRRVNAGYDSYDIYTATFYKERETSKEVGYLTCLNEGHPFNTVPTEDDIRKFLNIPKATASYIIELWMEAEEAFRNGDDEKCLELKEEFTSKYDLLLPEEREEVNEYLESVGG